MATNTGQRVFIWVIAIVMTVGTLAGFVAMMIAPGNDKIAAEQQQKANEKMMADMKAEQEKSVRPLDGYSAAPFDKASITELKVETLKEGDGTAATASSTVNANYFGWTSDGKIFDSTNKNGVTKPIDFPLNGVIQGWTKGLTGVKAGSVVKLSIPGAQAYGDTDNGDGRPFGPLVFIVELKEVK